jgi:hypothetical protein
MQEEMVRARKLQFRLGGSHLQFWILKCLLQYLGNSTRLRFWIPHHTISCDYLKLSRYARSNDYSVTIEMLTITLNNSSACSEIQKTASLDESAGCLPVVSHSRPDLYGIEPVCKHGLWPPVRSALQKLPVSVLVRVASTLNREKDVSARQVSEQPPCCLPLCVPNNSAPACTLCGR